MRRFNSFATTSSATVVSIVVIATVLTLVLVLLKLACFVKGGSKVLQVQTEISILMITITLQLC